MKWMNEISNLPRCLRIYVWLCLTTGQFMGLGLVSLEFNLMVHLRTRTKVTAHVKSQSGG